MEKHRTQTNNQIHLYAKIFLTSLILALIAGAPIEFDSPSSLSRESKLTESQVTPSADHACRLWGAVGSLHDSLVTDHLLEGTYSFQALAISNQDGWGMTCHSPSLLALGWDGPVIQKGGPRADHPHDTRFGEAVARSLTLDPSCMVVHIRNSSSGHVAAPDPHPFYHEGLIFAHNGTISRPALTNFLSIDDPAYLETHPPDFWNPHVDSELYMLYILKLREQGVDHGTRALSHSLQDAAVEAVLRIYDANAIVTACNFLAANDDTLFAMNFDPGDTEHYTLHYKKALGSWIISSEPVGSDTTGWQEMPPKSLGIFTAVSPPQFISVYPPNVPFLALRKQTVDDDLEGDSAGNKDQGCDAGETIELVISLANLGAPAALDVQATLSTNDQYCKITDDFEEYGEIPSGEERTCLEDFDLQIDPACPNRHQIDFTLAVTCTGRASWEFAFSLPVEAGIIELASFAIADSLGGDGDGLIEAGETIELFTQLTNSGGEDVTNLLGVLLIDHPSVTIIQGEAALDTLFIGQDTTLSPPFEFEVASDCPNPDLLLAGLAISADWGQGHETAIELPVGGFFDDFEIDTGEWTSSAVSDSAGFVDQWHRSSERNYTGGGAWSWKFGDAGDTTYANFADGALESPPVTLAPTSYLRFHHWMDAEVKGSFDNEGYDGGMVEISVDGSAWTQIFPNGGYTHTIYAGTSEPGPWSDGTEVYSGSFDWTEAIFTLSGLSGEARFRFRFGSNGAVAQEGWHIDDVAFYGLQSEPQAEIGDAEALPPLVPELSIGQPNPFESSTALLCRLPEKSKILIRIFDPSGRLIRTLVDGEKGAGNHRLVWDGRTEAGIQAGSGVYFCTMKAGKTTQTRKMILTK